MTSTPGLLFFILNRYNHSNPFLLFISKKSRHGPKFFERMFIKHLLRTRLNLLESSRLLSLWLLLCSPAGPTCPRRQPPNSLSEAALPLLPSVLPPRLVAALTLLLQSSFGHSWSCGLCPYFNRLPSSLPSAPGAGGLLSNSHNKVKTSKPGGAAGAANTWDGSAAVA